LSSLDPRWRADATCRTGLDLPVWWGVTLHEDLHTGIWFPDAGNPGFLAKRICAACPARRACLSFALAEHEEFGVWGGAGESIRRRLNWFATNGQWAEFAAARDRHFERLDLLASTGQQPPGTQPSFGAGATHGRPSTAARGCRCPRCSLASAVRTTKAKIRRSA
jgi:hypothetical protein